MNFIEVKAYADLKGGDPRDYIAEYVDTYWTPIYDQNYGTDYQQWQRIPLKFLKIETGLQPVGEK